MTPTMTPTRMTAWLEQAWMVRYLDHQLTGEEANWFEAYALDKPELLAMIEGDTRMRDALAADASMWHMERSVGRGGRQGGATGDMPPGVGEPPELEYARNKPDVRQGNMEVSVIRRRGVPGWLSMAATLVVGVGLGWIGTRSLAPGGAAPQLVASPTRIVYDTMRGEAAAPRVEHADSESPYVLIEVAVPPGAENVTLKLSDQPEQKLAVSTDGFAIFLVGRDEIVRRHKVTVRYLRTGSAAAQTIDLPAPAVQLR